MTFRSYSPFRGFIDFAFVDSESDFTAQLEGMTAYIPAVAKAPVRLGALLVKHALHSQATFSQRIIKHYTAQVLKEVGLVRPLPFSSTAFVFVTSFLSIIHFPRFIFKESVGVARGHRFAHIDRVWHRFGRVFVLPRTREGHCCLSEGLWHRGLQGMCVSASCILVSC